MRKKDSAFERIEQELNGCTWYTNQDKPKLTQAAKALHAAQQIADACGGTIDLVMPGIYEVESGGRCAGLVLFGRKHMQVIEF